MRCTKAEYVLANGMTFDIVRTTPADRTVCVLLGYNKLTVEIDPNDINQISNTCGQIMAAMHGNPGHDSNEWSRLYKAISRFKEPVTYEQQERKGRQATPAADKRQADGTELGHGVPKNGIAQGEDRPPAAPPTIPVGSDGRPVF